MSEAQIIDVLSRSREYFELSSVTENIRHSLIGYLIKGIFWLANQCQKVFDECFKFIDFTQYGPVQQVMSEVRGILVAILIISFLILGAILLFRPEKKPPILTNFLIGIFVFCCSTNLIASLNNILITGKNAVLNANGSNSAACEIISTNVTDLLYIDKRIGLVNIGSGNLPHATMDKNDISSLKFDEIIKKDDMATSEAKDIVEKKLVYTPFANSKYGLKDIDNSFILPDYFCEYYYRYSVNFFTIILSLISLCIVFLITGYKVFRLVWELLTAQLLAFIFSGDIVSGQAMRKIIDFVKNLYIIFVYIIISIKFYSVAVGFIGNNFPAEIRGFLLLFLAFAVIDGPNVIEKILGLDAGLQSGMAKGITLGHMMAGLGRTATSFVYQSKMNRNLRDMTDALRGETSGEGGNHGSNSMDNNSNMESMRNGDNSSSGMSDQDGNSSDNTETNGDNNSEMFGYAKEGDMSNSSTGEFYDSEGDFSADLNSYKDQSGFGEADHSENLQPDYSYREGSENVSRPEPSGKDDLKEGMRSAAETDHPENLQPGYSYREGSEDVSRPEPSGKDDLKEGMRSAAEADHPENLQPGYSYREGSEDVSRPEPSGKDDLKEGMRSAAEADHPENLQPGYSYREGSEDVSRPEPSGKDDLKEGMRSAAEADRLESMQPGYSYREGSEDVSRPEPSGKDDLKEGMRKAAEADRLESMQPGYSYREGSKDIKNQKFRNEQQKIGTVEYSDIPENISRDLKKADQKLNKNGLNGEKKNDQ